MSITVRKATEADKAKRKYVGSLRAKLSLHMTAAAPLSAQAIMLSFQRIILCMESHEACDEAL